MNHFSVEGKWWLPEAPTRHVAGTLSFDGDTPQLVLYDALRAFQMPAGQVAGAAAPTWEVEPIVHGRTRDGTDITLLQVGGANLKGPFHEVQESYEVDLVLEGCHTTSDRFAEMWCSFDYLEAWADPPSISREHLDEGTIQVNVDRVDLLDTEVEGTRIRLVAGVEGSAGDALIEMARWSAFATTPLAPLTAKDLLAFYVRPLQDLLMFCLGRPVTLTSFRLLPTDAVEPLATANAFFSALQRPSPATPTIADVKSYTAPTILTLNDSGLAPADLIVRWFDLWQERREVLTLLLAPFYAPFMYSEHGYGSTFQAAEALHNEVLATRDVEPADHAERVRAVVAALQSAGLDEPTVTWASNVLQSRNDKPLWRKVEDLTSATGTVGAAVLAADPTLGKTAAAARTGVSHGGATKTLDSVGRHWYGQALRWVVRTYLLTEFLGSATGAERRVAQSAPFQRAVTEVAATGNI